MEYLPLYSFLVLFLLIPLSLLGLFGIKFARSGGKRLLFSFVFVFVIITAFIIPTELTSYWKPTELEWYMRNLKEAEVLWSKIDVEGENIYIVFNINGIPRYYKIPWNLDTAQDLQDANSVAEQLRESGEGTGQIVMKYPFLSNEERQEMLKGEQESQKGIQAESDLDSRGGFFEDYYEDGIPEFYILSHPPTPLKGTEGS